MAQLPAGTLTFLFTDIEGSTRLWESDPDRMRRALARHDEILEGAVRAHGGDVFKHTGDGMCAVFSSASRTIDAAVAAQLALSSEEWADLPAIRARMGINTGNAEPIGDDYFGTPLNRCARIMSAAHGGQILCDATTAAIIERGDTANLRDLGSHRLRDLGEAQHLFQIMHAELPHAFPPLRALDAHAHNLPVPRTSFVGRLRELDDLKTAIAGARLVTVTGAGGSGKTRLALQAAAEVLHGYSDGVYLVELASITDPGQLAVRVAESVGVPLITGGPALSSGPGDLLRRYVEDKELLVILDNCEHLLDACAALVDDLLTVAERLEVVATSREPLGITGERVLRIPSLGVADDESSVEAVSRSEAGQLFADRAAMARADFTINNANVGAIAQICRRLDGIPLAIELAAARLRHLSVQQLADRLDDRFRILTGGGRTALPRQQTLQATLDWSHDLLDDRDRTLFRRLSVFVGSFPLAAVEGVCTDDDLDALDVLDVLGRLVDRSLVLLDDSEADPLYRLLETMRHFAQQKLIESGEATALRDQHRDWYAARVDIDATARAMYGYFEVPVHVQENVRLALDWALATEADDAAYRLIVQAAPQWMGRGLLDDGAEWLERVGARPWSPSVVEERGVVLILAAAFGNLRNEFVGGHQRALDAEAFVVDQGLRRLEPHALEALGIAASVARSIAEGEGHLQRAAESALELGFHLLASSIWGRVAGLRLGHDAEGARAAAEEAVASRASEGDDADLLVPWATLGFARLITGDHHGAAEATDEMDRILGDFPPEPWGSLEGVIPRAPVLAALGRAADARAELGAGLIGVRELAIPLAETAYLVGFAATETFGGDPRLGLVLLGAARRRFSEEGAWRAPIVGALYVQSTARARSLVSKEEAVAARDEGRSLTGDEAFALVT